MRVGWIGVAAALALGFGLSGEAARAQSAPTPPVRPPAEQMPAAAPSPGEVQYSPPPAVDPAAAQARGALSPAEIRELLDAAGATAKATREAVDYGRVMPDLLTQILAKLDKIEDKLDKVENAVKAQGAARRR